MGHETSEVSAGAWMDLLLYTNGCKYTYIYVIDDLWLFILPNQNEGEEQEEVVEPPRFRSPDVCSPFLRISL